MIIQHLHCYIYFVLKTQVSEDFCLLLLNKLKVCSKSVCAFNVIISSLLTLIPILLCFISTSVLNVWKEFFVKQLNVTVLVLKNH